MWIRFDCPSGHPVKVEEKFAGRMGRCPACGVKVKIPQPEPAHALTDSGVMDMLGGASSAAEPLPVHQEPPLGAVAGATAGSSVLGGGSVGQATRMCPSCRRKVSVRYQICPHCRTYMPIADLAEVNAIGARGVTMNCPHCGVPSFPGANACGNCGEALR